jgi:hypothetical protein
MQSVFGTIMSTLNVINIPICVNIYCYGHSHVQWKPVFVIVRIIKGTLRSKYRISLLLRILFNNSIPAESDAEFVQDYILINKIV